MITKEYGRYKLICDICYKEIEKDSFDECLNHAKLTGWETEKEDEEWYNYCQDCIEEGD